MTQYKAARPTPRGSEEDAEDMKFPFVELDKKLYKQYSQMQTIEHVHFYLNKAIGEPDGYTDMIYRITHALPTDVIYIHLNTPGGQLDTGVQMINAMRTSQAKVITILESCAYSLGTLIFLCGDEMIINEHCMMMFHNFNGGMIGKGNELVSELEATVNLFNALAQDIYFPFLSREELDRITRGEDMWMQTPEIKIRLERMMKALAEKEQQESEAEMARSTAELLKIADKVRKDAAKKANKGTPKKSTAKPPKASRASTQEV